MQDGLGGRAVTQGHGPAKAGTPNPRAKRARPLSDYAPKHDPVRDNCPVKAAIDVIRGRWKPHILHELHEGGPKRFSELRASLPQVTAQALSIQLRQLEADEIVTRTVYPEVPVRVEYALSEFGRTLSCVLEELDTWGTKYLARRKRNGPARR